MKNSSSRGAGNELGTAVNVKIIEEEDYQAMGGRFIDHVMM